MSNDRDVEDRLGEVFVSKILDHADEGHFEDSDLLYIARKLGETSGGPNKMIGNHKRRMKDKPPHRVELRSILSDFWNVKLYDLEREEGRNVLIEIFKSSEFTGDGNLALAKSLEHSLPPIVKSGAGLVSSPSFGDKERKAIVRAITQKSTDPGNDLQRMFFN